MAFLCLRYVELNTKLQVSFRRYNSAIPSYLRERPHHIIKHSMDRLSLAESIPNSNVTVIDMENGEFLVKSQSRLEEKKMYKVMFGTKQPSCECFDWERQRLPCNHFLPYSSTSRHGRLIDFQKNIEIPHSSMSIEMCS